MESMTIAELRDHTGKSRQTIHAQIKAGLWEPDGPPIPNKRGKPSQRYRPAKPRYVSERTPKSTIFEQRCRLAGRDPQEVLWLLLRNCRTKSKIESEPYNDPDLFSTGVFFTLYGEPHFIRCLFKGDGPPGLETEIARIIHRNDSPDLTIREIAKGHRPSFEKIWETAKFYVGSAIQARSWRYNCNPFIVTDFRNNQVRSKVVMHPRWHENFPRDFRERLWDNGLIVSTHQRKVSPRRIMVRESFSKLLFKLHQLVQERGEYMKKTTLRQLYVIKLLWFNDEEGNEPEWHKMQGKAAATLAELTGEPLETVKVFSESWARRYQCKPPASPTWKLINRIFGVVGDLPMPDAKTREGYKKIFGWDPADYAEDPPERKGDGSEASIDYWCQEWLRTQQRTDAAKKYTQHHHDKPPKRWKGDDWPGDRYQSVFEAAQRLGP